MRTVARVLVLGGTGFVGPHVVRRLVERGDEVCVFHRGESEPELPVRVQHVHGPFRSFSDHVGELQEFAPDVVIDTVPYHDKNGHGVLHFAGVAQQAVVITSGDVYRAFARFLGSEPGPPDPVPLTEGSALREKPSPDLGEEIDFDNVEVERAVAQDDLPTTVLRSSVIFGPNDRFHRLYQYVKRMDDERPAIILDARFAVWRWSRSFVQNVAQAVVLAAVTPAAAGRTYNVAPAETLTESEWVAAIAEAHGWDGQVIAAPSEVLPEHLRFPFNTAQHVVLDSSRIREELSYVEQVPLRDALARTIEWERMNPPEVTPAAFDYDAEDEVLARLKCAS
jgi:nucleoside-diphosphate-sugar epimerase